MCLVWFWHKRARVHFVVFFAMDYRRGRQDVHRECTARWHDIAGFHQILKIPMVFLWFQQERPGRNFAIFCEKSIGFLMFLCWNACKHNVFGMILTWTRACALCGIFCKGLSPWTTGRPCWEEKTRKMLILYCFLQVRMGGPGWAGYLPAWGGSRSIF